MARKNNSRNDNWGNIERYQYFYPFMKFYDDDYAVFTPYNFENNDMHDDAVLNDAEDALVFARFGGNALFMVEGYDENGFLCMVSISGKSLTDAEAGFYDQCDKGWHKAFGLHTPKYAVAYKHNYKTNEYDVVDTELLDECDSYDRVGVEFLSDSRYYYAGIKTRSDAVQYMNDLREAREDFYHDHRIDYWMPSVLSWRYCLDLLDVSEDDFYKPTPWEAYI